MTNIYVWKDGYLVDGSYEASKYELYLRDKTTSRFIKIGDIPPFNKRKLTKRLKSLYHVHILRNREAGSTKPL